MRRGKAERLTGDYPAELAPLAERAERPGRPQPGGRRAPAHPRRQPGPRPEDPALGDAGRGPASARARWPRWSAARPRPCSHQVDHHLRRARAAARSQSSGERTPLSPRCWTSWRAPWSGSSATRASRSTGTPPDDLAFQGERQDLHGDGRQRHGERRQVVASAASGSRAERRPGERLRLSIEDDGPGLPPERREEVLKRGARLDESAPGLGPGPVHHRRTGPRLRRLDRPGGLRPGRPEGLPRAAQFLRVFEALTRA